MEATKILKTLELIKPKMQIAHNAFKKATEPIRKLILEDYEIGDDSIEICYYSRANDFENRTITKVELFEFVNDHYSTYSYMGYSEDEYTDTRIASEYFEDNRSAVLTDYINARP